MKIIEEIKKKELPVIIFGSGIVGEVIYHACSKNKIKVECFCDNNINKTKNKLCGLDILHVPSLKNIYKDAVFLISAADIKDVVEQLKNIGYDNWYPCIDILRDFGIYQYKFKAPMEFVEYAVATALLCHDNYMMPDKLFIRSVDIIITEKCSLKCKNCSNLMQYYQNPVNCDDEEVLKSIDLFCNIVDEINEFRVIGGEPFMNKNFDTVIKRLSKEPKVKKIVIYTNGTIIPKEEKIECLKDKKVLLIITDYGELSKKIKEMKSLLDKYNIAYYAEKARGWTDCAKIIKHNRDKEGQKEIFRKCCAKNTVTLTKGRLYRCPFVANADRLGAIPKLEEDHIDLFKMTAEDISNELIKKKIKDYLLWKEYLEACDYCNGRSFDDPEIEPAEQLDRPLEYKKLQ